MTVTRTATPGAGTRGRAREAGGRRANGRLTAPPVLVRVVRNGVVESVHRGDIVEVDAAGRIIRLIGNPDRIVMLRSCVKPLGLVAFIEGGGVEAFEVTAAELAIMAGSHSGEDLHVRTVQGMFRRAGLSQTLLACGSEGAPIDALTAARLARDGEKAGAIRQNCSGQHASLILLARMRGWSVEDYWRDDHPVQVAYREVLARIFGTRPDRLVTAIDACGIPTYAFPLREVARAYALLAAADEISSSDPRASLAPAFLRIRDAMIAHPEMVGGQRDRLDTSLMKALPGRIVSKGGAESLRSLAILAKAAAATSRRSTASEGPSTGGGPRGMAIKIEDGDGYNRANMAATVEALRLAGILDGAPLRELARYHRPMTMDPHRRHASEMIAEFELAPVGELIG